VFSAAVATGGAVDNWVGNDAACQSQRAACSIRYGGAFSYSINTAAGRSYRLRFTFSEVWWTAAGQRLFDVMVDGATVLAGIDPFALAGAKFTPVVREVTLTAVGANMVVSFQARQDNAALAALEVRPLSDVASVDAWLDNACGSFCETKVPGSVVLLDIGLDNIQRRACRKVALRLSLLLLTGWCSSSW